MYVYVLDFVLALRSWVDVDHSKEYQEPPSVETFEQQEQFEEDKYNMNIPITFKYNFILYAYKDHPSHFVTLYMYLGLHFG